MQEIAELVRSGQLNWCLTIVLEPLGVINVVSKEGEILLRIRI